MEIKNTYVIIMAGGIGSRFWPLSTEEKPKQFLDILNMDKSLIQITYDRVLKLVPKERIYVLTNEKYVYLVNEQLPELSNEQILTEPERKNTAPCITYAAAKIYALDSSANLVVSPSDHLILKEERFTEIVLKGIKNAEKGERLTTLGIKPTRPDTGYGYIQFHQDGENVGGQIKKVKQFAEKPNREMAEIFLKSGDYYWNAGIFIWKAATILKAVQKFKPDLYHEFCSEFSVYNTPAEKKYVSNAFKTCENISIDFAVLENAKNIDVVLADFDWSDLGTWGSLHSLLDNDYKGNVVHNKKTLMIDASDNLVKLPKEKTAIIQGLENYIVVESENRLLILNKNKEQNLKQYLNRLTEKDKLD